MTREELIKKVALKMDEIASSDDVIVPVGTGDNNPLYTQINNLLNESVNDVLMKAPIYRLQNQIATTKSSTEAATVNFHRTAGKIDVPSDFLRLVSITDTQFQRPIVELAIEGDDIDKRQHNKFLIAGSAKPVAVLGRDAAGKRIITCYSYERTNDLVIALNLNYVKQYDNDKDTTADANLDDYMCDIVSWVCAGNVFFAQGDTDKGKICHENASSLMI